MQWKRLKGEAREPKNGGQRTKEVWNRASDARCAGVPNLGSIGGARRNILPQLCGGSCSRVLRRARSPPPLTVHRRNHLHDPLQRTDRRPSRLYLGSDLEYPLDSSRASSVSQSPPSGWPPVRLAAQSSRAEVEAPRE